MAKKLDKNSYPEKASPDDFKCFGPPATKDGEFDGVKICDMGCFTQDGKDSNKYYHAAVVQHRKSKKWYAYFEWGRTGADSPSFQFVACDTEQQAGLRDPPRPRGRCLARGAVRSGSDRAGRR